MNEESLAAQESVLVDITAERIDVRALAEFVSDPRAGSSVVFNGSVRDHSPGRADVSRLEYEAYGEVVKEKIVEIVQEAFGRWPILKVAAVHRVGSLEVGESAVCVAVSSAHRKDSFDACRYVIDELKFRVPIWKKEHWPGGAEWVEEGG
ncbi:MAG: molybdenum cofactor biosynthesis protein MoaE [Actinobacteria bacterium]|nr:MAG: molybdenum cofactor biosynthesis protein MoaE [Actinomycetota bacterium]